LTRNKNDLANNVVSAHACVAVEILALETYVSTASPACQHWSFLQYIVDIEKLSP
jgi:hypothetical protein